MTSTLSDTVGLAEQAIKAYDAACDLLRHRNAALLALQTERPRQKLEALARVCAQKHPGSSTGKLFSISEAGDVLQIDPAYAEYKARVAAAEAEVKTAEDLKSYAFLNCQLRIAQFKAEGGLT